MAPSASEISSVWGPRAFPQPGDADMAFLTSTDSETVHYHYGPKDLVTILFYVFITIILHAVVQEYILDVSDAVWILRSQAGEMWWAEGPRLRGHCSSVPLSLLICMP